MDPTIGPSVVWGTYPGSGQSDTFGDSGAPGRLAEAILLPEPANRMPTHARTCRGNRRVNRNS